MTKEELEYIDSIEIGCPIDSAMIRWTIRLFLIGLIVGCLIMLLSGFCIVQDGINLACI